MPAPIQSDRHNSVRIFISVAEDSADLHASSLVRAARELLPGAHFYGFAGPRMQSEGVESIGDLTAHAAMLGGILKIAGRGWRALRTAQASWRASRPDLVIVMDSTALHLPMAAAARRAGLPVLYYIAPQTWASRAGRNAKLARDVRHVACILPFEQAYFRAAGVPATFVGHPLIEALERTPPLAAPPALLAGDSPLVALLPGSRTGVIERMLPLQLSIVDRLKPKVRVAVSCASERRQPQIARILRRMGRDHPILLDQNAALLSAADLVLVASGTATLEVAYYDKPMVVVYDAGPVLRLGYRLGGHRLLTTPHLALVNILAGARIVPEFMPFVPDPSQVAETVDQLLASPADRAKMTARLQDVIRPLRDSRASARVCDLISAILADDPASA